jgi:predicted phage tail protein
MAGADDQGPADVIARIERLEAQRELQELDSAWAKQRERLMDRDGDGRLREPAGQVVWFGAGLTFVGAGALAAFSRSSVSLVLVAIGLALVLFGVPHAIKRRRSYRAARAAYEARREELEDEHARGG